MEPTVKASMYAVKLPVFQKSVFYSILNLNLAPVATLQVKNLLWVLAGVIECVTKLVK